MSKPWTPQRESWRCVCGHVVEDHGDQPLWPGKSLWPCLVCACEDFIEDLITGYLWEEGS